MEQCLHSTLNNIEFQKQNKKMLLYIKREIVMKHNTKNTYLYFMFIKKTILINKSQNMLSDIFNFSSLRQK